LPALQEQPQVHITRSQSTVKFRVLVGPPTDPSIREQISSGTLPFSWLEYAKNCFRLVSIAISVGMVPVS
jgi:hypothetical protein